MFNEVRNSGREKKRQIAFTLVEIMIVVLIIGILLAIAIPNFVRAREATRAKACIGNLRKIEYAKDSWAMDRNKTTSAVPTNSDLFGVGKYIELEPSCPASGTYSINAVDMAPVCSYGTTYGTDLAHDILAH